MHESAFRVGNGQLPGLLHYVLTKQQPTSSHVLAWALGCCRWSGCEAWPRQTIGDSSCHCQHNQVTIWPCSQNQLVHIAGWGFWIHQLRDRNASAYALSCESLGCNCQINWAILSILCVWLTLPDYVDVVGGVVCVLLIYKKKYFSRSDGTREQEIK